MQATIYTLKEAADLLSLHPETIRRAYRDGKLKAALVGRILRISEAELERYWVALGGGQLWNKKKSALPPPPEPKTTKAKATKKKAKKTTSKKARA
jgi:excisionase family DNA binding protein